MRLGPHGLLCRFAERKLGIPDIDSAPYRKIMLPREGGKSTLITQAWAIQLILQDPNISLLICNEKLEVACAFLAGIKAQFTQNTLLRELFPDICPDPKQTVWATDKIVVQRNTTRKDPTIFCIGTGGSVTGMRPDHIIGDDILSLEAAENARSGQADITGRINRWIAALPNLLNSNADPFPTITFIGTHYYPGDSYEHIETAFGYGEPRRVWHVSLKLEDGATQTIAVSRVGDVAVFKRSGIEDGKSWWPENPRFTMPAMAKARMADPVLFSCNILNDPIASDIVSFREEWLRYYDWLAPGTLRINPPDGPPKAFHLPDLDCIALVDPGGFGQQRGADRMRGAVVVTGTTPGDLKHLILEAWSEKSTYHQVIEQVCAFATRYRLRRIAVEVVAQQTAFLELLRRTLTDRKLTVAIEAVKPGITQKEQRVLALEPYFQRGQMYIGKGAQFTEFREQYRTFPRGRRVDILDALAYGPLVWRRVAGGTAQAQTRQQQEREAYYRRRGFTTIPRT